MALVRRPSARRFDASFESDPAVKESSNGHAIEDPGGENVGRKLRLGSPRLPIVD